MNALSEVRTLWPAGIGCCIVALAVLALALAAFFGVLPFVLSLPGREAVPLYLDVLVVELWAIAKYADCGTGIAGALALECRASAVWRAVAASPAAVPLLVRAGMVGAAMVVAGWVAFDRIAMGTSPKDRAMHVRGRRLVQDAAARRSLRGYLSRLGKPRRNGLWLMPHVQLPPAAESYNLLAIGTQGAGKSGLLRAWVDQLIERGDRVVLHDVKGDMTAGLPVHRFVLLAPHDARSAAWDVARDIGDRAGALEFAARSIKAAQADSMWADGARAIWADAIVSLIIKHGRRWTLQDLYKLLTLPPEDFREVLINTGAASAELIAIDPDGGVQRTSMSLLITLWVAALTTLKPLVDAWEAIPAVRRFSLADWLKDDGRIPSVIVIQKSSQYPELSALVGGLLVELLAGRLLSPSRQRNPDHKVALVLDELAELGNLRRLPNLLAVGRDVGVTTIAAVQDLGQLVDAYGETTARALEARFGIKFIGRLTAGDTAERVSKLLVGERFVEFFDRNRGGSNHPPQRRREKHPVFPADRMEVELGVRTGGRTLLIRCLVLGLGDPALVDIPFTEWTDQRAGHRPATWLRGPARKVVR